MNMTFKDRLHLAAVIITLLVFGHYFYKAYAILAQPEATLTAITGLMIGTVVIFIVLIVAVAIVQGIVGYKDAAQPEDERDRLMGLLATRNGHYVLLLGLVGVFVGLYLGATALQLANIVLLAWVVAECVKSLSVIIYARVGV